VTQVSRGTADPSPREISEQLERLLNGQAFKSSERLCGFLRFIVRKTLAGEAGEIKEYSIATAVYGRPESFDPKTDSIVRVEATRLRTNRGSITRARVSMIQCCSKFPKERTPRSFAREVIAPTPAPPAAGERVSPHQRLKWKGIACAAAAIAIAAISIQ